MDITEGVEDSQCPAGGMCKDNICRCNTDIADERFTSCGKCAWLEQ
jgi:hypothetical protein